MNHSTVQMHILPILLLILKFTNSEHIICDNSTHPCDHYVKCSEDGSDCLIECNGANACKAPGVWGNNQHNHSINCAKNSDCTVRCNGTDACAGYNKMFCPLAPHSCTVECHQYNSCEDLFVLGKEGGNLVVLTDFARHEWLDVECPDAPHTCDILGGSLRLTYIDARNSGALTLHCFEGGTCRNGWYYCPTGDYLCDINVKSYFVNGLIEGGGGDLVIEVNGAIGYNMDWTCPTDRTCNVTCTGGACLHFSDRIDGRQASVFNYFIMTSDMLQTSASDPKWLYGVRCPDDKIRAAPKCNIFVSNPEGYVNLANVRIYAVEGINDVTFICDHSQYDRNCTYFNSSSAPIIHCTEDYSESCTLDPNTLRCVNASAVCNDLIFTFDPTLEPTLDPTLEPSQPTLDPTSQPTSDPTLDPTSEPTLDPTSQPSGAPSASFTEANYTISIELKQCTDEEVCDEKKQEVEHRIIALLSNTTAVTYLESEVIGNKLVIRLSAKTHPGQILNVDYIRYHIEKEIEDSDGSNVFGDVSVDREGEKQQAIETTVITSVSVDSQDRDDIIGFITEYALVSFILLAYGAAVCGIVMCAYFCIRSIIKRKKDKPGVELAAMTNSADKNDNIDVTGMENKNCADCNCALLGVEVFVSTNDGSLHCANCLRKALAEHKEEDERDGGNDDDDDDAIHLESNSSDSDHSMYEKKGNQTNGNCVTQEDDNTNPIPLVMGEVDNGSNYTVEGENNDANVKTNETAGFTAGNV